MARFKEFQRQIREGKINYGDKILDGIVYLAVNELEDVALAVPKVDSKNTKDIIKIKVYRKNVDVTVNVRVFYTQSISETAFKIQEAVRHNIETMTEYKVNSVNVNVLGVIFSKENNNEENVPSKPIIEIKENDTSLKTDVKEKKTTTKSQKNKPVSKSTTKKKVTKKSKDKEAQ